MTVMLPAPPAGAAEAPAVVVVWESGGLSPLSRVAVSAAADLVGAEASVVLAGTLRLMGVTRRGEDVQRPPPGFGIPMAVSAVDHRQARPVLSRTLASVLGAGEVAMSRMTADLRGARKGDLVELEGWNGTVEPLRVGAVLPDADLGWQELVVSTEVASRLGLDRPSSAWVWGGDPGRTEQVLERFLAGRPVSVRRPGEAVDTTDLPLATVLVKQRFGEFSFRRSGVGDGIVIDPVWLDERIVDVTLPVLGPFRCHRAVVPYLRGAVSELIASGAMAAIDPVDFQLAGGCFNSRLMRGGDKGLALSRHAWGVAIDLNPSSNPYGGPVTLDEEVGAIMRRWGFAWGAGWTVPDGMHFEWNHVPPIEEACSDLSVDPAARPQDPWTVYPRQGPCAARRSVSRGTLRRP